MKTMELALIHCPACGHEVDLASSRDHANDPQPGHATMCVYCTTVLRFLPDMTLEVMPQEEINALPPIIQMEIILARQHFAGKFSQDRKEASQ